MNEINKDSKIFEELIKKQLKDINENYKLNYNDLKRLSLKLDNSIFNENECAIYNKENKKNYSNFYLNNKKISIQRLVYINFVEKLDQHKYLKKTCENKNNCCNIKHMTNI
jgi:hypothetical protein